MSHKPPSISSPPRLMLSYLNKDLFSQEIYTTVITGYVLKFGHPMSLRNFGTHCRTHTLVTHSYPFFWWANLTSPASQRPSLIEGPLLTLPQIDVFRCDVCSTWYFTFFMKDGDLEMCIFTIFK